MAGYWIRVLVSLGMGVVESPILKLGTKWVWLSQNISRVGYKILRITEIQVWLQFSPRLETIERVLLEQDSKAIGYGSAYG